jgi:hypothetical protein
MRGTEGENEGRERAIGRGTRQGRHRGKRRVGRQRERDLGDRLKRRTKGENSVEKQRERI